MKKLLIIFTSMTLLFIVGCSKKDNSTTDAPAKEKTVVENKNQNQVKKPDITKAPVKKTDPALEETLNNTIKDLFNAKQSEDLDKLLSFYSPSSDIYSQTQKMMPDVFKDYDLEYAVENINIVKSNEDSASIEVTFVTKKVKGPEFPSSRATEVYSLKKENEEFKITDSELIKSEYLN